MEPLAGPAGTLWRYATSPTPPAAPAGAPPPVAAAPGPVLFICHDLPKGLGQGPEVGRTLPSLADRLARESGWRVVTATLRGAGASEGDFSAPGWLEDLAAVIAAESVSGQPVAVAGFGLGGALALRRAALDPHIGAVACLGTPADLSAWVGEAGTLLARCRASGVVRATDFPTDPAAWAAEVRQLRPLEAAAALAGRPLLVVQGADDPDVPSAAAADLAEAATGPTEVRLVPGAGHWLRADPRVVATLIGWLERRR
jgi:pimeloyl-ACP methyl ester carboxylesterase